MLISALIFDLGNTLIQQKSDALRRLDQMQLELMPHVKRALELLHTRYTIALLTDTGLSNSQHVSAALVSLSIRKYFDALVTSVDVGVQKPDERMFAAVLSALNVAPENCLMVGNDLIRDIEPAKILGMRTAYFSASDAAANTVADIQFSSFSELPRLVFELEGRKNDPQ